MTQNGMHSVYPYLDRNWFDAPAWDHAWWQKQKKRVLLYLHPGKGLVINQVEHSSSQDIKGSIHSSFAKATVKAGKPATISDDWYLIEAVPGQKDVFRAAPQKSAIYQVCRVIEDGIKDRPDIHFLRANIYLNARRYRQAYRMFKKIEQTIPKEDKALFYYYYAKAAFGVGKYGEYLKHLDQAISLDKEAYQSTLVDAYLKVAEQYNQTGQLDKYIEYLVKAVGESPQTASLHLKLGYAYEEDRQYSKAADQWQMVLDLEPDHAKRMELKSLIQKARHQTAESKKTTD